MITPFYGVPRMTHHLRGIGYEVNPKRVRRLYRKMDLYATGPRPNTSKPHKGASHVIYSYLLRGLKVTRPNQVWVMDITLNFFPSLEGREEVYKNYIIYNANN